MLYLRNEISFSYIKGTASVNNTVKPEFLASTNFRQNTVKERSRCLFFASVGLVQNINNSTNIKILLEI